MNNIKNLIGTVIVLLTLWGCEESNSDYVIGSNPDEFAISPVAIPVIADGGTYELKINGNESWTTELTNSNSSANNWVTLSETSGTGQKTITVTVQPSTSFVILREILIEVSSTEKVLKSKVLQETLVLGENEVLINGLVWSTVSVDAPGTFASSPEDRGMYYQFNRKIGYPSGLNGDPAPANWPTDYINDGTNWLEENDPSPEDWRVPTTEEMAALWETGATWVWPEQTGFSVPGMIIGVPKSVALLATKDNLKQLGCLFLPQSGWRNSSGVVDRGWLVSVRSGNNLSETHGGMSLGDSGGYRDVWGWGDGQKVRAASIRPVKNIKIED